MNGSLSLSSRDLSEKRSDRQCVKIRLLKVNVIRHAGTLHTHSSQYTEFSVQKGHSRTNGDCSSVSRCAVSRETKQVCGRQDRLESTTVDKLLSAASGQLLTCSRAALAHCEPGVGWRRSRRPNPRRQAQTARPPHVATMPDSALAAPGTRERSPNRIKLIQSSRVPFKGVLFGMCASSSRRAGYCRSGGRLCPRPSA